MGLAEEERGKKFFSCKGIVQKTVVQYQAGYRGVPQNESIVNSFFSKRNPMQDGPFRCFSRMRGGGGEGGKRLPP